jgi:hypothetical protein
MLIRARPDRAVASLGWLAAWQVKEQFLCVLGHVGKNPLSMMAALR